MLKPSLTFRRSGDDGGYDEKQEYADVEEAISAGKQYLSDGYTGFSVFNRDTQIIEHTEGEFDVESAYSVDVLKINNIPVTSVADDDRFVDGLNFDVDYFDRRFEDKSIPFLGNDESIKAILLSTQYLSATKAEIAAYFDAVHDHQKRIDYLKSIFNNAFSEVIIPDGRRMGYKPYKNVLQLWEGSMSSPTAQGYYKFMKALGVDIVYNHADYRLLGSKALDALSEYREVNLFLRGIVPLIGYRSDYVYYERSERFAGESKYPLKKMIRFAIDGITSFSVKPLKLISNLGILMCVFSLIGFIYALVSYFVGVAQSGWASIICSIWFIGGLQMLGIGIVGSYVGRIYSEVKQRPRYRIEKTIINGEPDEEEEAGENDKDGKNAS